MRRHPSFRPSLLTLESRWLPTAAAYPDTYRNLIAESFAARAAQADNPVIFLGDSITNYWGDQHTTAAGTPIFLSTFAPMGAANFGIAGDTTQNLLYRIESGELAGQPKVAVVMIGVNDLIGGATPAATAANIADVVSTIQAESPDTKVLLLGILPTEIDSINSKVSQVDTLIDGLGHLPGVTYLDLQSDFLGTNGLARPSLLKDLVHPSTAGYQVIANAIDGSLLGLLDPTTTPAPSTTSAVPGGPTTSKSANYTSDPATSSLPPELIPIVVDLASLGQTAPTSTTSTTTHKPTANDISTIRVN